MIVYDVTNEDSFRNVQSWLHELHQNCIGASIIIGRWQYHTVLVMLIVLMILIINDCFSWK